LLNRGNRRERENGRKRELAGTRGISAWKLLEKGKEKKEKKKNKNLNVRISRQLRREGL